MMKKFLMALFALVAFSLSMNAQVYYRGATGKGYSTTTKLSSRYRNHKTVINDKSRDVTLELKDGRKAWFANVGGKHFLGWEDECITMTEKTKYENFRKLYESVKAKQKAKKKAESKTAEDEDQNAFSSGNLNITGKSD